MILEFFLIVQYWSKEKVFQFCYLFFLNLYNFQTVENEKEMLEPLKDLLRFIYFQDQNQIYQVHRLFELIY
jgi:hypothetical protein